MSLMSVDERREMGRQARKEVSRSSHADWSPTADRPDPVDLLTSQDHTRLPWLVPVRHFRMKESPFTFYRGTATIMAGDLVGTPTSGISVQLGGDAHLSNFGVYASPERRLVFDANDFDETLRGPWEWDLKRLATSFTIAAQHLGFPVDVARDCTAYCSQAYREAIIRYAGMGHVELWYDHLDVEDVRTALHVDAEELNRRLDRFERRAMSKTSEQALKKLTVTKNGHHRIRHEPPTLIPLHQLPEEFGGSAIEQDALAAIEQYAATLADDRRWLFERYELVDMAVKAVGVGSVGTRCLIALFQGRDAGDPLFLQAKEAGPSVLEEHLGATSYANHGQRVVEGQRMIQAQSDIFLGWTRTRAGIDYYIRQLRDWKGSVEVENSTPEQMHFYAGVCGQTLARGHARSGDAIALASYVGTGAKLDRAVAAFAEAYAEQNRRDYASFLDAIESGRLEVQAG